MNPAQQKLKDIPMWPYSALDKKREIVVFSPCFEEDIECLIEMYETFEPKLAIQGLPPLDRNTRVQWIQTAVETAVNIRAEIAGKTVAHGSIFPMPDPSRAEFSLFVHNLYQNRGIGTMLTMVLINAARRVGYEKLWAFEERNNTRAMVIYHKAGFEEVRRDRIEIELELELALTPEELDLSAAVPAVERPTGEVNAPNYLLNQKLRPDTTSVLVFSRAFEDFKFSDDHPFLPKRSRLVYDLLQRHKLLDLEGVQVMEPAPIDENSLLAFHDPDYFYYLVMASKGAFVPRMLKYGLGTTDNPVADGVLEYSELVVGATVMSADILVKNPNVKLVFSPTGGLHHGGPNYASGFCYLNDVVVGIKYLLQSGMKVLYVDIDAHHGDGVQFAFYNEPRVLKISLHESGRTLFPWNSGFENELGEGPGYGYNVNVPLSPGTGDEIYRKAFQSIVKPLAEAFHPDICVSSIGVDTMFSDPLSHLSLTNNIYAEVVSEICRFAPSTLLLGAGGYNPKNIARDWTLAWSVIHDAEPEVDYFGQMGAMMAAAEVEGASLRDSYPFISPGKIAEAKVEAKRVTQYLEKHIFPIHGITPRTT